MSIAFIRRRTAAVGSCVPSRSRLATIGRLVCLGFLSIMLQGIASPAARADLVFGTLRTSGSGYGFGSFDISSPTGSPPVAPVAVPEPVSLVLLAALFGAVGMRATRGRRLRIHLK
jgi:hypothetical protein